MSTDDFPAEDKPATIHEEREREFGRLIWEHEQNGAIRGYTHEGEFPNKNLSRSTAAEYHFKLEHPDYDKIMSTLEQELRVKETEGENPQSRNVEGEREVDKEASSWNLHHLSLW
eukprot:GEZU01028854.1.p1 GENE.GEZU01028854.1~~GEZU01028854.1.p1  ORF type:complete len:115 (+),score=20.66 GEZU01028854.1:31-375(+)